MITEIAQIDITPGSEDDFEAAMATAVPYFFSAPGCHSVRLRRSIEFSSRYRLMVEWETVEHHTVQFRQSDGFARWRELAGPYFSGALQVEHVADVLRSR